MVLMLSFDTSNVHLVEFTFFLIKNSDNYRRCALRNGYFIWYKSLDIFKLWCEFVYEEGFWDWWTEYFVIHLIISMRHFYLENSDIFNQVHIFYCLKVDFKYQFRRTFYLLMSTQLFTICFLEFWRKKMSNILAKGQ